MPISTNDPRIVITGMSGRFPECSNIAEFKDALFAGVDLVTDDPRRWENDLWNLPNRMGKIKDLGLFDAQFFGVHAKQANVMDPQLRLLLETTYEAIIDAGFNPAELGGTKTGVFVGASVSEAEEFWSIDPETVDGYVITGCSRGMFANRISFAFDFKGPSFAVDTACSSSLIAFNEAVQSLRSGACDTAIVAAVNLLINPMLSLKYHKLSLLSRDGKCKAFDASASGYVRSEAVVSIVLQKGDNARRIYATVLGCKTNSDGHTPEGITFPDGASQKRLLLETCASAKVNPNEVVYFEAHGTGTKVGDPQETNALADVFCSERNGRTSALKIGSVKTNMGHGETASGLCGLVKILIAMEEGVIPGNLHFKDGNPDIQGLFDGRLEVVTKNTPWEGGIVGINSFGFGGSNVNILLQSYTKPKLTSTSRIPRLILASGRTEEATKAMLSATDLETLALLNKIQSKDIPNHPHRGYSLNSKVEISMKTQPRPVWFVFTGMGSQWPGMARGMMDITPFRESIERSEKILRPLGVDLKKILCEDTTLDSVLASFVSITSIQVALVDTLTSLGVKPDGIIGHSLGEVGCAYADNAMTAEQAILTAYFRGYAITDSRLDPGTMAAVGLSWEELSKRVPSDICLACHNSTESVTISGPPSSITAFVNTLTSEGIFAKQVQSCGISFHSKYIAPAGPKLQKSLEGILKTPKLRSEKWISTSIPEKLWDTAMAQHSSVAYHVNNLLSPVLFAEGLRHIPEDAVLIEIAPHGLLQAILKRSMGLKSINVALMKANHPDNVEFFLQGLGRLYLSGLNPNLESIYPPVKYPVSRGTQSLGWMVRWDHSTHWNVPTFEDVHRPSSNQIEIDTSLPSNTYLFDHLINGVPSFPGSGYIVMVWKTWAKLKQTDFEKLSVEISNITFYQPVIVRGTLRFGVEISALSGYFEITQNGVLVCSGQVQTIPNVGGLVEVADVRGMRKNDIYKLMKRRGYEYQTEFRGMEAWDGMNSGVVEWNSNYVTFIDNILQFAILVDGTDSFYVSTSIDTISICPQNLKPLVPVTADSETVKCGGIEITGMVTRIIPKKVNLPITVETMSGNELPKEMEVDNAYVDTLNRGDLSTLQWIQASGGNKIKVAFVGINPRDVQVASGLLKESGLGSEFSGYDVMGKPVMGYLKSGALRTSLGKSDFIWDVPENWSLAEAATIPIAYMTAYYALFIRGQLQSSDTILIHDGATPYGEAAITVALSQNSTVFTTTSEIAYLRQRFPQIPPHHIALKHTVPVNLILTPTTLTKHVQIPKNTTEFNINFDSAAIADQVSATKLLENGIKDGVVKPLRCDVFTDVVEAFRSTSVNKVLVKVGEKVVGVPRVYFDGGVYFVKDGMDLGMVVLEYLIDRGVTNLIYSKSGLQEYEEYLIGKWIEGGVKIELKDELTIEDQVDGCIIMGSYEVGDKVILHVSKEACKANYSGVHIQTELHLTSQILDLALTFKTSLVIKEVVAPIMKVTPAQQVAEIMGLSLDKTPMDSTLADLGLDSFMLQEIRQKLGLDEVSSLTFRKLIEMGDSSGIVEMSMLSQILKVIGLKSVDGMDEKVTLRDLGMDSIMANEVREILLVRDIVMTDVLGLTLGEIKAM